MAYIKQEVLKAKTVGYRILPAVTKCYRADGSFDLYLMQPMPPMLWSMTVEGYADACCCGGNISDIVWGRYYFADNGYNSSSLLSSSVHIQRNASGYGEVLNTSMISIRLDNPYGLVPTYGAATAGQGGKGWIYQATERWDWKGNYVEGPPSYNEFLDPQDWQIIRVRAVSDDNGKFNSAWSDAHLSDFRQRIHKSSDLYRVYS